MNRERKVVLGLAASQALFATVSVLMVTVAGLAGSQIAPSATAATLPLASVSLGTALATIPASLFMARWGRRPGFVLGALLGSAGGIVAVLAMQVSGFFLLCLGGLLIGFFQAFAQFYRFAAAEAASDAFRSRAISYVLAGGIVAAFVGPHLGAWTKNMLPGADYAGSFAAVAAIGLVAAALLASIRMTPDQAPQASDEPQRPLREIIAQPKFLAAVGGGAAAFGVMVLVMAATPLSMVAHQHEVSQAATVIQWHVLAMFVPSFFTGALIARIGVLPLMGIGALLLLCQVAIAVSGVTFLNYLTSLMLLGLGWNFLYVGGSTLLTETYRPSERGKVQALNDFTIVCVTAVASFSAGALHETFGWRGLNITALPFLLATGALLLTVGFRGRRAASEAG